MAQSGGLPTVPLQAASAPSFADWLAGVRAEAVARGISEATVDRALDGLEPLPVVIQRDRTQAELIMPLDKYLARRLTPRLVRTARRMLAEHGALLRKVAAAYGLPPEVVVSLWGLESNFGRFSGVRPTMAALATLAYDRRRSSLFHQELFAALTILDRGDIDPAKMKGSWAGAMGQPQFMPSSYLQFAEDFDGDGQRDIWKSKADVFASIANDLKAHGWVASQPWGYAVQLSKAVAARVEEEVPPREGGCEAMHQMRGPLPLARWQEQGVRLAGGRKLTGSFDASLVRAGRRAFLVSSNYDALLAYNCAHAYALSAALLADRIRSAATGRDRTRRSALPSGPG